MLTFCAGVPEAMAKADTRNGVPGSATSIRQQAVTPASKSNKNSKPPGLHLHMLASFKAKWRTRYAFCVYAVVKAEGPYASPSQMGSHPRQQSCSVESRPVPRLAHPPVPPGSSPPSMHLSAMQTVLPQLATACNPRAHPSQAKAFQSNDTENQRLGDVHTPDSISTKQKSSGRRKSRPKRPQWQDVSIDLSALQASQAESSASNMQQADQTSSSMLKVDIPSAAHMSGVSPASPSPPKRQLLHSPKQTSKQHSGNHLLPALSQSQSHQEPPAPEALSAWHENIGQDQLWQQHQHRLSQDTSQSVAHQSSATATHDTFHFAEPPPCLPPLHQTSTMPAAHMARRPGPVEDVGRSRDLHVGKSRDLCVGKSGDLYEDKSRYLHVDNSRDLCVDKSRGLHVGHHEDPRSTQQVPMQYMRHPFGSGSPGGLHKLHRLLRPIPTAKRSSDPQQPSQEGSTAEVQTVQQRSSHQVVQQGSPRMQPPGLHSTDLHLRRLQPICSPRSIALHEQHDEGQQQQLAKVMHQHSMQRDMSMSAPSSRYEQAHMTADPTSSSRTLISREGAQERVAEQPQAPQNDEQDVNLRLQQVCGGHCM